MTLLRVLCHEFVLAQTLTGPARRCTRWRRVRFRLHIRRPKVPQLLDTSKSNAVKIQLRAVVLFHTMVCSTAPCDVSISER